MKARALLFALGLAILITAWQVWPSDERRIRRLVHELGDVFDGRPMTTDFERAARLAPLARALAPDVVVEGVAAQGLDGAGVLTSRESVVGGAMAALRVMPDLVVSVESVDVSIWPDQARASARVGLAIGRESGDSGPWRDITELTIDLVKSGDVWLVARMAPERPLRP
jgi:hypothetical protein